MGSLIVTAGILVVALLVTLYRWLRRQLRVEKAGERRDDDGEAEPSSGVEDAAAEGFFQVIAKFLGG